MVEAKFDATRTIAKEVDAAIEKLGVVSSGFVSLALLYKDAEVLVTVSKNLDGKDGEQDQMAQLSSVQSMMATLGDEYTCELKDSSAKLVPKFIGSTNA